MTTKPQALKLIFLYSRRSTWRSKPILGELPPYNPLFHLTRSDYRHAAGDTISSRLDGLSDIDVFSRQYHHPQSSDCRDTTN